MTDQRKLPVIDGKSTDGVEYDRALELAREFGALQAGRVSISYIQRHMQIGYNASTRLVEAMQAMGEVTPPGPDGVRHLVQR